MRLSSTTSHTWAMMSWNRTRPSWRNSSIITTASTATEVCCECYIIVFPFHIAVPFIQKLNLFCIWGLWETREWWLFLFQREVLSVMRSLKSWWRPWASILTMRMRKKKKRPQPQQLRWWGKRRMNEWWGGAQWRVRKTPGLVQCRS